MYKYQQVTEVLEELLEQDRSLITELTADDLLDDPKLEGIGKRTILNTLRAFRIKHNLKSQQMKTKHNLVTSFLKNLAIEMTEDEFKKLSFKDIASDSALKFIGKTTISIALAEYKKKLFGVPLDQHEINLNERIEVFSSDPQEEIDKVYKTIAENTKRIRLVLSMSQRRLAEALNISPSRLAKIEQRKNTTDRI